MLNTYHNNPTTNNSFKINAVSGMLVKNHPDSFMIYCRMDSNTAKHLFNTDEPYISIDYIRRGVVILQVLLCGNDHVMCEVVPKECWHDEI